MPRNQEELTFKEKVHVLKFLETQSKRKAADAFRLSKASVNNMKKWTVEYLKQMKHENNKFCRKIRKTSNDEINKAILNWFNKMRLLNAHILGPMIQEAVLQFSK
jgi:tRNA-dihydrouridine synthase